MLSRDHNILWLPESNGYPTDMIFSHTHWAKMGATRKTITVTEQQDKWIKVQINGGDFTNDSEYIRDLIRRDKAR